MIDNTPIWFLVIVAAVIWTVALVVLWRAVNRAPEVSGRDVVTGDDLWAERALSEYNTNTATR